MTNRDLIHHPATLFGLYGLMCVTLALFVIPTWGWTYWDFGDGNYLYIARRVREGMVLYKDILAPQPPVHTWAGVIAQWLGESLFGSALTGARLYCLLTRMAGGLMVLLLARRYFGCPFRALAAAATFLLLPIGFWWSLGYQSENLEIVFLVGALWLLTGWSPRAAVVAGVLSGLACQCNMTGAPYLLANALFLAFRMPRLLPWYLGAGLGTFAIIGVAANIATEGYYLSNVILNQVGTFPRTDILRVMSGDPTDGFLRYAWNKVTGEAAKVVELEGALIIAAVVGALERITRHPGGETGEDRSAWLRTELLAWSLIAGLLSICFTAKGGTVNYIFVLGEPMVALFAGHSLVLLGRWALRGPGSIRDHLMDTRWLLRPLFVLLVLGMAWYPASRNIRFTMSEQQCELPESGVMQLKLFIQTYADPGDTILAPPFYAWLTDTNVAGEIAENYIWNIKYLNESFDADLYGKPTGEGVAKMEEVAALLRERKVKVVLLDLAQTGQVPMIKQAISEHYELAEEEPFRTRNTSLGLYIPKGTGKRHLPISDSP